MSFTLTQLSVTRDCFPVDLDDNIVEAVEMFTLQLNSTTERVTTNPDMATITILDNDSENTLSHTHLHTQYLALQLLL